MQKILLAIFLIFSFHAVNAQSKKVKLMMQEISGEWSLDDNGNVTYVKVLELPELSKSEIFSRALNYFVYNYNSGKSAIQTKDESIGRLVAKGFYDNVHKGISIATVYYDAFHIARVDAQEGRARIILSLTEYETEMLMDGNTTFSLIPISDNFPVNPKGRGKTMFGKAFYASHIASMNTLTKLETALRDGNTSKEIENDSW